MAKYMAAQLVVVKLGGNSYNLSEEQLVQEITHATDSILDVGSSTLVFKTAKLVYGLDFEKEPLSSKLELYEQFLRKMLGEKPCNLIIDLMVDSMQKYKIPHGNNPR